MALVRCTCLVGEIDPDQAVRPLVADPHCDYVLHRLESEIEEI